MKKLLLLIVIILNCSQFSAQISNDSLLLNKLMFKNSDYREFMHKEHAFFSCGLSCNAINFPNAANSDWIKQRWGFPVIGRITYFPLIFDASLFNARTTQYRYKVDSPYLIPPYQSTNYNLYHSLGYNASLSVCPLLLFPYVNRLLSETIVPYFGFGYQDSQLSLEDTQIEVLDYSSLNLSSWIWKAGCNIYVNRLPFTITIEYGQTVNKDKLRKFNCFSLGVFFDMRFNSLKSDGKPLKLFFE